MLLQLLANGLVAGCLYALVALGFALIYNTTRIFHIAHGALYTSSAYSLYVFLVLLRWPLPLAFGATLVLSALLGMAVELTVYAPLVKKGTSTLTALLSSLGLYIALVNTIALIFGNETKVLRPGVEKTYHIGPVLLTRIQVTQALAFGLLFPAVVLLLRKTLWGKAVRAVRDNPTLTQVMGLNLQAIRLSVFALGSALSAVAAMLQALDVGMDPHVGMPVLLTAAVALIVGGVGIFEGTALGAFVLGALQSLIIWKVSARWVDAVTFTVLILFLLFRPEGLLGRRRRLEEAVG